MKTIIAPAFAAAALIACAEPFGAAEKAVLRDVAKQAEAKMKEAAALEGKAVTLLPVHGDEDGYMERLLIGAVVSSGRTGVISNDEKNDERFAYDAKSRLVSGGFATEQKAFLQHSRYSAIPQLHNSTM